MFGALTGLFIGVLLDIVANAFVRQIPDGLAIIAITFFCYPPIAIPTTVTGLVAALRGNRNAVNPEKPRASAAIASLLVGLLPFLAVIYISQTF